ncbi:MAG: geranylgeranyl reductase family protein [Candidatus Thorarchaeota archaeon]|nr:geranylgeranyl reductase family protein [Candidatus Thorarchaeota archaeon]
MKRTDVVIVGAGSAGCVTARRCAELGLRTFLLDRKPSESVGDKVCGDEVSRTHFEATGIDFPSGEEVSSVVAGADVYPPNMINELKVRGWKDFDGWTVNRIKFGQRLLEEAMRAGVQFKPNIHVGGPTFRGEKVTGVTYKDRSTGEKSSVSSKIVVDASGFSSVIRKKIESPLVEVEIDKRDIALCYREILELRMPLAEPEVARVFLGGKYAPQGYGWIFPKGKQQVNAGVGISGGQGRGSPKALFMNFKEDYPLLFRSKVIAAGGGAVPVRRPVWSLVGNGVAFVGDAALMVNPIHGGGIGAGMRAGIILGEVAKEAIARKNTSAKGLWHFNTRFLSNFGRRLASLEIFKRLLADVSDDDMDYGFEKRILEAGDLMAANKGDGFQMSAFNKMKRVKRAAGKLGLLRSIQRATSLMKKIDKEYAQYPSGPDGLELWKTKVQNIIDSAVFKKIG